MADRTDTITLTDGHLFGAVGGGASGFKDAEPRFGSLRAKFECLGSIDVDAGACREFERRIGVKATCRDLFDLDQYRAFYGRDPPPGWTQAMPADIRVGMQNRTPDVGFLSAPCKGFSGLLPESTSLTDKYQALNALTFRGVWLWLEAFQDDPSPLIFFENVPRIATRGRHLLDQIIALLQHYGYATAETTHDCGELGGLAQSRKRFLLVARHREKVPPFMYEPPKRRLLGVGEILDRMPLPGDPRSGPMHRMPALQWKTWVRLAFVEAGSDWRSLNKLNVEEGVLTDFGITPEADWHNGVLGVNRWDESCGVLQAQSRVMNGNFAVADPRVDGHPKSVQLGVRTWGQPAAVVKGDVSVGTGPYSVADPRLQGAPRFNNTFRIVRYGDRAPAVHGPGGPGGGLAVADPRAPDGRHVNGKFRVTAYEQPANAVIAASTTGNGAFVVADPRTSWGPNTHQNKLRVTPYGDEAKAIQASQQVASGALSVADPRPACLNRDGREGYSSQAHYGVVPWGGSANAVPAFAKNNNGPWSVADPRGGVIIDEPPLLLPEPADRLVCVIISLDGTHHRPFTTMELAALQSYIDPEEAFSFQFEGKSDSQHREWIGNMVPRAAARAMAEVAGRTLLMARVGETYTLSNQPIWVTPARSLEIALSVDAPELPA